ncbi:hypothetical protein J6590_080298, partial [Homalodisca vitripennis]
MPTKYPCGTCSVGVRYSGLKCNGPCQLWYHAGCQSISEKALKKITCTEINHWKCVTCKKDSSTNTSKVESLPLTSQIELHNEIEEVHDKIKNLQDPDDLETSLTLAAEAGNALLAENRNLKRELYDMKNSQLTQHMRVTFELEKIKYEANIEELESQIQTLENRNSRLAESLQEAELQFCREKESHTNLIQAFEEQDREKELAILNYEKEIKQLHTTLKNLKRSYQENPDSDKEIKIYKTSETHTENIQSQLLVQNSGKSNNLTLIQDISLKSRQEQMENSVKALQNQFQSYANKIQDWPQARIHFNRNKRKTKTHFSVSLQMAKIAPATQISNSKLTEEIENTSVVCSDTVFKLTKSPPLNSKPRAKDETCEEFFAKNIVFFKDHMIKHYNCLTEKNKSLPIFHPRSPVQAEVHQLHNFLCLSNMTNSKLKS